MSDLTEQFEAAAAEAQQLPKKPDNADMLRLYAFYKQGTVGNVTGERPGMVDFVGRAKYDAWKDLDGTSQDDAMHSYIDLVEELKAGS